MAPTRHQVWINNWLHQNGFLGLNRSTAVSFKQTLYKIGLSPAAIREAAPERLKLAILQFFERQKGRAIASEMETDSSKAERKGVVDWLTERVAIDFYDVDWTQTQAFSTGTTAVGYVWLNVAGRDPQGIIAGDDEYEQTRQTIAAALRDWEPVGEVLFREQLWEGPQIENAPDIIIRWAAATTDARYFQTRFSSHHLMKPVPNDYASHRPEGMFLLHGATVRPDEAEQHADILDLAPTFLWLLGQPVPTYMDGRVLAEQFELETAVDKIEVELEQNVGETAVDLSAEDEAAIKDTLRGLGYLE